MKREVSFWQKIPIIYQVSNFNDKKNPNNKNFTRYFKEFFWDP